LTSARNDTSYTLNSDDMEALAAIGLASNIIQLIEVTKGIALTVKDIRRSVSSFYAETNRFRSLAELVRKDIDTELHTKSAHECIAILEQGSRCSAVAETSSSCSVVASPRTNIFLTRTREVSCMRTEWQIAALHVTESV
jgi:hypothetical protein